MTTAIKATTAARATGVSAATRIAAAALLGAVALSGCDSGGSGDTGGVGATPGATASTTGGDDGGAGDSAADGDGVDGSWLATTGGRAVALIVNGKQAALFSTGRTICTGTGGRGGRAARDPPRRVQVPYDRHGGLRQQDHAQRYLGGWSRHGDVHAVDRRGTTVGPANGEPGLLTFAKPIAGRATARRAHA
ncbi:hypothetical protein [Streptomyces sp. NBC_01788]|uniref:hypothetical protein n=1 Tax=Streptomyces sp. NBC_01788 TaxID=2975940 RepID=UPI002DD8DCB4|nr:hypothetical protein [Streptomyces sp. NBC_01788]